ncbi:anti-sigma factor [Ancylomarina sp.]|uniref:anti-sigma factor family protein n=1 Tax=Ancylomarina sp. TaxID=1970196 RepID=UPI003568C7AF
MSCITNELIQKYIDGETNLEERVFVKDHLTNCESCESKLIAHRKRAIDIKNALNSLTENTIGIPPMILPLQVNKRRLVLKRRLIYALSAACVLLFCIIIFPTNRDLKQNEISMLQSFDEDYDANLPISQQKMIINVVDPTGKVTEFYVE